MKTLTPLKSILSFLFTVTFLTNSFAQTDTTAVSGCIYPIYDNYNEQATTDDGSCEKAGCIDELALNYDAIANISDSTCYYLDCMDEEADNYNPNALVEGYCVYLGCTDAASSSFDEDANRDDGTCEYLGCTDETAFNTTEGANTNDGSCYPVIKGCTDELAHNYVAASGDVFSDVNTSVDSLCTYLGCTYDICLITILQLPQTMALVLSLTTDVQMLPHSIIIWMPIQTMSLVTHTFMGVWIRLQIIMLT